MAFTVQDAIDDARDQHFTFNDRDHPSKALLNRLNNAVAQLRRRIMEIDETALATTQTQAMPLAVHENGIPLTTGTINVIAVAAQPTGTPAPNPIPVEVIPHAHRFDIGPATLAAWEVNNVLYLRSPSTLWTNIASVGILSIPAYARLTTLTANVGLPDDCRTMLASDLAAFMASRRKTDALAPFDVRAFKDQATADAQAYYLSIGSKIAGRVYRTRDVMGG